MTDPMGGVTSNGYDAIGQLVQTTDAMKGVKSYVYDANGNLIKETDPLGYSKSHVYDQLNRLVSTTDAEGHVSAIGYDAVGNVVSATDGDGNTISYVYDMLNRLISTTDAEGGQVRFEYDANGNLTKKTDALGNITSYRYDAINNPVEMVNPEGNASTKEYDKDGRVTKVIDEEGAVTNYSYDGNGNVVSVTDALGNTTKTAYDEMDRVSSIVDARGAVTTYTYTATGLIATETNAKGAVTTYTYDANGNKLSETNGENETTTYTYDALNRVISTTNANNQTKTFTYDAKGQIKSVTDENGHATQYVYDGNGNVIETIDALGSSSYYEYNASGKLTKATLNRIDTQDNIAEQQVTLYQYDGNNLVTKIINAAGKEKLFVYDANGNLIQKTDENGNVTEYSYSRIDLVNNINYNDGKNVNFAYNKVGQLVRMDDWNGTTSFEVDLLKRITAVTDHKGKKVSYTYDEVGNNSSITYPDNSVTAYEYDLTGKMTKVTEPGNKVTGYTYDQAGRLKTMLYPDSWEEIYTYDEVGRLLEVKDTDPSDQTLKTIKQSYTYDAKGNKLSEYKRGNGTGSAKENITYQYDALDRVISSHENFGNSTRGYQYDSLGNLNYETTDGNKFTDYKYNILNQLTYKTSDSNGSEYYTYEYDNRGNLVKENLTKAGKVSVEGSYVYNEMNKLSMGTNNIGETSTYVYNGLGYLVQNVWEIKKNAYGYQEIQPTTVVAGQVVVDTATGKKDSKEKKTAEVVLADPELNKTTTVTKDFVLDYTRNLQDVLYETETGNLNYRYGYGLQRLSATISPIDNAAGAIVNNGVVKLYYHQDYLGTTDYLTSDVTGKVTSWTMYNEWGEITHNAVLKCGQRELDLVKNYTGYEYDPVLGQYYAKNRMYDAENRRFTQLDPAMDGDNWYAYVGNNPVNYVDPLGYFSLSDFASSSVDKVREYGINAVNSAINYFGFSYDKNNDIFYANENGWQRKYGYMDEFNEYSIFANINIMWLPCIFSFENKEWRIECWKGRYGITIGGEIGVYTFAGTMTLAEYFEKVHCEEDKNGAFGAIINALKAVNPSKTVDWYASAKKDEYIGMAFTIYKINRNLFGKYESTEELFSRSSQSHWWLTGFKLGYAKKEDLIMKAKLNFKSQGMRDAYELALKDHNDVSEIREPSFLSISFTSH